MPELTVVAPEGSHFEFEELRTKNGTVSLGEQPILYWDTIEGLRAHFGDEDVKKMTNGTSFKVSAQGIARRMAADSRSYDEIAQAQIDFRPGNKITGPITPGTRAAKAAKSAAEKVDGDALARLLDKLANNPELLAEYLTSDDEATV